MQFSRRSTLIGALASFLPAAARAQTDDVAMNYEKASGGHVGFWAENIVSGVRLGWRPDERFVMCSTFKASLAALVLKRIDLGEERLDLPVAFTAADIKDWYAPVAQANLAKGELSVSDMCKAAVEESDNTCASLLLARVGGPAAVTSFWRACGDQVSRLDDPEPLLNRIPLGGVRDTTTPRAMASTLGAFVLGDVLSEASRSQLKTWLVGSVTGFRRLRAGLPRDWIVGDKTGNNGSDAAGDIAVAWADPNTPLVVAAYTRGGAPNDAQLETLFASIGRLVAQRLV